jgi:5-methylcytosine-specific restriction enzyme A
LIKLGTEPKGIMGSGVTSSKPSPRPHWDPRRSTEEAYYADLWFDFLSRDVLVTWSELQRPPFSSFNWAAQSSGLTIPQSIAQQLEKLWQVRTGANAAPIVGTIPAPSFPEGSRRRVIVNAYERNPLARRECIMHHGVRCKVCDVDLGERFGSIASGRIEVHHLLPISKIGRTYQVDPINDLVPVCPTCHYVIHLRVPPLSIVEARDLLNT